MGHIQTLFYSGSYYIYFSLLMITRFTWVYFMKKIKKISKLQEFKLTVEGVHKKKKLKGVIDNDE